MDGPTITNYVFYLALIAMSGVGEYFLHFPTGTTAALLGAVVGHSVSSVSLAQGANAANVANNTETAKKGGTI